MAGGELAAFLTDPRLRRGPALATLLTLLALNVAVSFARDPLLRERDANLLVNGANIPAAAPGAPPAAAGAPIRYDRSVGEQLEAYWGAIPDARQQPLAIVAGMSQNYVVNDAQPGDLTIPEWLDDELAPMGVRAFGLAAPNLSTEEALFLLLATISDPSTRPTSFIYG